MTFAWTYIMASDRCNKMVTKRATREETWRVFFLLRLHNGGILKMIVLLSFTVINDYCQHERQKASFLIKCLINRFSCSAAVRHKFVLKHCTKFWLRFVHMLHVKYYTGSKTIALSEKATEALLLPAASNLTLKPSDSCCFLKSIMEMLTGSECCWNVFTWNYLCIWIMTSQIDSEVNVWQEMETRIKTRLSVQPAGYWDSITFSLHKYHCSHTPSTSLHKYVGIPNRAAPLSSLSVKVFLFRDQQLCPLSQMFWHRPVLAIHCWSASCRGSGGQWPAVHLLETVIVTWGFGDKSPQGFGVSLSAGVVIHDCSAKQVCVFTSLSVNPHCVILRVSLWPGRSILFLRSCRTNTAGCFGQPTSQTAMTEATQDCEATVCICQCHLRVWCIYMLQCCVVN